ncbi:Uncharacterised protein [Neisseria subflava]|uniref:Uncharacterized protein n=1 Tax=Neisseria subflava TaxID=28449 RepID=A0A9X9QZ41_NEISU|nr:Uncharacterised protein [Neisseria subflava]
MPHSFVKKGLLYRKTDRSSDYPTDVAFRDKVYVKPCIFP